MRRGHIFIYGTVFFLTVLLFLAAKPVDLYAQSARTLSAGKLVLAGRRLRCGSTPTVLSTSVPGFGMARPGLILLNPRTIRQFPVAVRWMIYYHECGHIRGIVSETGAGELFYGTPGPDFTQSAHHKTIPRRRQMDDLLP